MIQMLYHQPLLIIKKDKKYFPVQNFFDNKILNYFHIEKEQPYISFKQYLGKHCYILLYNILCNLSDRPTIGYQNIKNIKYLDISTDSVLTQEDKNKLYNYLYNSPEDVYVEGYKTIPEKHFFNKSTISFHQISTHEPDYVDFIKGYPFAFTGNEYEHSKHIIDTLFYFDFSKRKLYFYIVLKEYFPQHHSNLLLANKEISYIKFQEINFDTLFNFIDYSHHKLPLYMNDFSEFIKVSVKEEKMLESMFFKEYNNLYLP